MDRSSIKKLLLKISQYSQKNTCVGIFFKIKMQAFSLETLSKRGLTQVFSCEYCEIFKSTCFGEHL